MTNLHPAALLCFALTLYSCGSDDQFSQSNGGSYSPSGSSSKSDETAEVVIESERTAVPDQETENAEVPNVEPDSDLVFQMLPAMNPRRDGTEGTKLQDIIAHLPASYGNTYYDADEITWGHETSHGIHSYIRTNIARTPRMNGFYVLQNRFIVFPEPGIRKRDVIPFIPQELRGSRYNLYIAGQIEWDDTALYVWDEWNAYVNGSDVGVEFVEKGLWRHGGRDGVAGAIEFNIYAVALAMAIAQLEPSYLTTNKNFTKFLAFNLKRSMRAFQTGKEFRDFKQDGQERLYKTLLDSAAAKKMRQFLVSHYGKPWCEATFGAGDW